MYWTNVPNKIHDDLDKYAIYESGNILLKFQGGVRMRLNGLSQEMVDQFEESYTENKMFHLTLLRIINSAEEVIQFGQRERESRWCQKHI